MNLWLFFRIARKHFAAVKPYRSDGLTIALASIKDMNVLFSNFAFVTCIRGLCQVMEAAQADHDLVFKLQVRLLLASLLIYPGNTVMVILLQPPTSLKCCSCIMHLAIYVTPIEVETVKPNGPVSCRLWG
jgi:Ca2+/Na+ antiporter